MLQPHSDCGRPHAVGSDAFPPRFFTCGKAQALPAGSILHAYGMRAGPWSPLANPILPANGRMGRRVAADILQPHSGRPNGILLGMDTL